MREQVGIVEDFDGGSLEATFTPTKMTDQQLDCICNIANQVRGFANKNGVTEESFIHDVRAFMAVSAHVRMIAASIHFGAGENGWEPDMLLTHITHNVTHPELAEAVKIINE